MTLNLCAAAATVALLLPAPAPAQAADWVGRFDTGLAPWAGLRAAPGLGPEVGPARGWISAAHTPSTSFH
jgi:hypothetical protein